MVGAFTGCLDIRSDAEDAGSRGALEPAAPDAGGNSPEAASVGPCTSPGFRFVLLGGRDQVRSWSAPMLRVGCGTGPYRLLGDAPGTGAALRLSISRSTGAVVEASYSTREVGADGEVWGEYEAPVELTSSRIQVLAGAPSQPFELEGSILGPFGPVTIAVAGCANLQAEPC
jgi:hypothetical protein